MGCLQAGQILVFTQIPDGRGGRRYRKCFRVGDGRVLKPSGAAVPERSFRPERVMSIAADLDIELLFLPAYSPNLNLIERLWKLVKKRCLTNKYYATFDDFCNAIDNCLVELGGAAKAELDSLITLNFQFFPNSNS